MYFQIVINPICSFLHVNLSCIFICIFTANHSTYIFICVHGFYFCQWPYFLSTCTSLRNLWRYCVFFTYALYREEWPSVLKRCNQNRKAPGSNVTRRSPGLKNPTLLRGSRWPSGRTGKNEVIKIGWVRLLSR